MKKFIFKLQVLLDVNISLEKEQKNQLAVINYKIEALQAEHELILSEISSNINDYIILIGGMLNVNQIKNRNYYIKHLNNNLLNIQEKIKKQNKEKGKIQDILVQTMTKRKSLEKLREKQYELYLENVKKEDEKSIQDFTSYNYTQSYE